LIKQNLPDSDRCNPAVRWFDLKSDLPHFVF